MTTTSVSEARATLPELLDRVAAGEEITITRHGHEVAVLVRPGALLVRRADAAIADAERLRTLLQRGRTTPCRTFRRSTPSEPTSSPPR